MLPAVVLSLAQKNHRRESNKKKLKLPARTSGVRKFLSSKNILVKYGFFLKSTKFSHYIPKIVLGRLSSLFLRIPFSVMYKHFIL